MPECGLRSWVPEELELRLEYASLELPQQTRLKNRHHHYHLRVRRIGRLATKCCPSRLDRTGVIEQRNDSANSVIANWS